MVTLPRTAFELPYQRASSFSHNFNSASISPSSSPNLTVPLRPEIRLNFRRGLLVPLVSNNNRAVLSHLPPVRSHRLAPILLTLNPRLAPSATYGTEKFIKEQDNVPDRQAHDRSAPVFTTRG